jgi:hypothetical protein
VRYHIWDDAWLPDVLAGKTKETVGDAHEHLLSLTAEELHGEFAAHNQRAIAAVRDVDDLNRTVHLSYGIFRHGSISNAMSASAPSGPTTWRS